MEEYILPIKDIKLIIRFSNLVVDENNRKFKQRKEDLQPRM